MVVDHPREDSKTLAARTSAIIGRPINAELVYEEQSHGHSQEHLAWDIEPIVVNDFSPSEL
jgi:hypothetical protein